MSKTGDETTIGLLASVFAVSVSEFLRHSKY